MTALVAVLIRFKAKKIHVNGNFPDNSDVQRSLQESHFFDHLFSDTYPDSDSYRVSSGSSILTHAKRKVDSELGERVIEAASKTVWGTSRRCPGVQRVLIELMHNTNNHAAGPRKEAKHWWLSVKHSKDDHRVAFAFVDFGVGVFNSLRDKKVGNAFFGALAKLRDKVLYGSDAEVLRLIFDGELHRTATGKYYRGKGLPGVYNAFRKNELSALVMITNRVYFNSGTGEYKILKNEFMGTFVYWELNTANKSLPHAA